MSKLSIKNLSKVYKQNVEAVKNISFDIEEGDFFVLLGPSGCGKSTTLRLIGGLENTSSGNIYLDSKEITNTDPKDRDLAFVFQNYALYPHMNVKQNLSFSLRLKKINNKIIDDKINQVSSLLQINNLLDRKPAELSGGQRQRVALGRALVRKPKAFLLDEPLSNLDARLRVLMRTELIRIQKMLNATFVYVTHDQVEAMTLADRIVILNLGNIEQVGTPDEIYNNPSNIFVAQFIGTPKMNILPLNNENIISDNKINFLGNEITFEKIKFDKSKYFIGIRPEHFNVSNESKFKFKPKIELVENLGNEKIVYMSNDNLELSAKISSQIDFQNELRFDTKDIFIFDENGSRI